MKNQKLKKGASLQIQSITGSNDQKARLIELGLRQGVSVIYLGQTSFKGPHLFRTGPITVALRDEEVLCLNL